MLEYYVIEIVPDDGIYQLNERLNILGKSGWHVTGINNLIIILEREISPRIEETVTDKEKIVTYSFPL